ncbi:hypothetical protein GCM10025776_16040 [Corallincola platygyrae]
MDPQLRYVVDLLERMTGRKFELFALDYVEASATEAVSVTYNPQAQIQNSAPDFPADNTPILRIQQIKETEQSLYQAQGSVLIGDETRYFSVSLEMARQQEVTRASITTEQALKDPLVLNLDGKGASLSSETHALDLNADGHSEQVATLADGSFYLVNDANSNGLADDGRELFGALSGDGFKELAQLDSNGNGFVDIEDDEFSQLRLWQPETDEWLSLNDAGVIALYLGSESTPYMLKDENLELLGAIRSTGFFLREDGPAGTMQQVDLVV